MLHYLSGHELQKKFREGEITAVAIANTFLQQIDSVDPKVKAFLRVSRDRVLAKAAALDQKRSQGLPLGRLAGVPIAVKDNIHVESEPTTCGSQILGQFKAPFSATAVELLEKEDALILGKTNLDEFGMGSSTENSSFFHTCNPWDLTRVPGGSSGGSAAAVASRMAPIALGSDTGGSVRQPAAFCGIYGFKPSYGRVSRWGLVAYASSLDVIGPMAHDLRDIASVMEVIGHPCPRDATCLLTEAENYEKGSRESLVGLRIGVPTHFLQGLNEEASSHFMKSIEALKSEGAVIVEVGLDLLKHSLAVYYIIATAEATTNLARFDGIRYGKRSTRAQTLDEIYRFSREEGFGPEVKRRILMGNFCLSSDQQQAFFSKAQKVRRLIIDKYNEALEQCDMIALPTAPTTAYKIGAINDPLQMYLGDIYTTSVNLAGLPALSLPTGLNEEGLPWGLQLIARHGEDRLLIQSALQMSEKLGWQSSRPPIC